MNKPLTKEEREVAGVAIYWGIPEQVRSVISSLISAEAYWREAVKNQEPWVGCEQDHDDKFTYWMCQFCQSETDKPQTEERIHKPSCPWLLAQEPA